MCWPAPMPSSSEVGVMAWVRRWWWQAVARLRGEGGGEAGSAVVEFVFLAILLMVPLVYLVLMLARLQAGAYAASAAARESGRLFVTAPDEASAVARSRAAANLALANMGFTEGSRLDLSCSATPCLTPGAAVTSRVTVTVPLPLIPAFARGFIPLEVPLHAQNVSEVDTYRSGP